MNRITKAVLSPAARNARYTPTRSASAYDDHSLGGVLGAVMFRIPEVQ